MKNVNQYFILGAVLFNISFSQAQVINDDFEGNGTISNWTGDDCNLTQPSVNPFKQGTNQSSNVLKYEDTGGDYANIRFETLQNISFSSKSAFTLQVYVPSSSIVGNQPNQISLKLQDGKIAQPWTTQTEIIKPLVLDTWQTLTFDFAAGSYKNLDPTSEEPVNRRDFNRVVIQINGENNKDDVSAYIDDLDFVKSTGGSSNTSPYTNLIWSDEFNNNGAIDNEKWHHQTKLPDGNGWYNGEVQHYTDKQANSFELSGNLNIVAQKENFSDQGVTKNYTSARLNSKFAFTYGRVEVRAQLPRGVGTWPAIWMLGKNINELGGYWQPTFGTTGWPACGEIDIMEHWGSNQNFVQSAMHTPSSNGATINKGGKTVPNASDMFHVYSVDWFEDRMVFSIDNNELYVYEPQQLNPSTWPFNEDQYILLNIAIESGVSSSFTKSAMLIDYVRVYDNDTSTVSINKIDQMDGGFKIFPNPVSGRLQVISEDGSKEFLWKIIDLSLGKEVLSGEMNSNQNLIDVEALDSGIYAISIWDEQSNYTKRFIKQ